jgi:hypothetical protein
MSHRFFAMTAILMVSAPCFLRAGEGPMPQWRRVVNTDQMAGYVDTQTWKRGNLKAEVSVKWILANAREIETTSGVESYVVSKESSTYDCIKRTVATRPVAKYADVREARRLETVEEVMVFVKPVPVAPETAEEQILEFVCFTALPSSTREPIQ